MEKSEVGHLGDSGSHSPSDDEKNAGLKAGNVLDDGLPPDPDAHLSAEERAKIVRKP